MVRFGAAVVSRALEFVLLFGGVPLAMAAGLLPRWPIPVLLLVALAVTVGLRADSGFPWARIFTLALPARRLRGVLLRCVLIGLALAVAVAVIAPERFLVFPRRAPWLWLVVMLLYPVLSAAPQELVFRVFLLHRYRCLFPEPRAAFLASAGAFAFAHILFGHWLSVVLSFAAGLLFTRTYLASGSFWLVALEHAILGDLAFTVGLGEFFYRPVLER